MPSVLPYGAWPSPITSDVLVAGELRLGWPAFGPGGALLWQERRPTEDGRGVVVRRGPDGERRDVTPEGVDVRSRVHEYGGAAWLLLGEDVVFSNDADGRLYRQVPGDAPRALTPEPEAPRALRYADGDAAPAGAWIACVREAHRAGAVDNELVAVPAEGGEPTVLASGHDFYGAPRLSPDGSRIAWLTWDHPRMPWDGTDLWVAEVRPDRSLGDPEHVAGGPEESIVSPAWCPDGTLHHVSDRTGWWNLYRGAAEPIAPIEAEAGVPLWLLGAESYVFLADGTIACAMTSDGIGWLGVVRPQSSTIERVDVEHVPGGIPRLVTDGRRVAYVGAAPIRGSAVVVVDVAGGGEQVVARASERDPDPAWISVPRAIDFPGEDGATAHALFNPPVNPDVRAPADERPPLLVLTHGGPTAHVSDALDIEVQYWTSRGFAVVDVNYGGSTGYGRAYRERLNGRWGIVDVEDCIAAARHLADTGEVDGSRMAIRGGSAGGYTTLCALTFHDAFAAGASHYGVADLEALARDTHKFEARYLDGLIGPYPERADIYRERSPVHAADRISCPVILLQGVEDPVVPLEQAEAMVAALERRGVPYAYLAFEGEQHGFRRAENIRRAAEAELAFYGRIWGFEPADEIEPVVIHNS